MSTNKTCYFGGVKDQKTNRQTHILLLYSGQFSALSQFQKLAFRGQKIARTENQKVWIHVLDIGKEEGKRLGIEIVDASKIKLDALLSGGAAPGGGWIEVKYRTF